jgi:hypothetical protein
MTGSSTTGFGGSRLVEVSVEVIDEVSDMAGLSATGVGDSFGFSELDDEPSIDVEDVVEVVVAVAVAVLVEVSTGGLAGVGTS